MLRIKAGVLADDYKISVTVNNGPVRAQNVVYFAVYRWHFVLRIRARIINQAVINGKPKVLLWRFIVRVVQVFLLAHKKTPRWVSGVYYGGLLGACLQRRVNPVGCDLKIVSV